MRLLVIKPSSLGDIVHALLVVSALRSKRPDVSVDWVVKAEFADVIEASGVVDSMIIYNRKPSWAILSTLGQLRRLNYDMLWDMQGLARSGLMTFAAKSPWKIGQVDSGCYHGWPGQKRLNIILANGPMRWIY
jgi:ADP-heptose:LPS heptosyltransferase